jgi:hypothetical protein
MHDAQGTNDRRHRRSALPTESLQWLLEAQRTRGALVSVTLATDDGLPVAAVGDDADVLAAIAPSLARGACRDALGIPLESITVHSFSVAGEPLHLAMRGGDLTQHAVIARVGSQGAARILGG